MRGQKKKKKIISIYDGGSQNLSPFPSSQKSTTIQASPFKPNLQGKKKQSGKGHKNKNSPTQSEIPFPETTLFKEQTKTRILRLLPRRLVPHIHSLELQSQSQSRHYNTSQQAREQPRVLQHLRLKGIDGFPREAGEFLIPQKLAEPEQVGD